MLTRCSSQHESHARPNDQKMPMCDRLRTVSVHCTLFCRTFTSLYDENKVCEAFILGMFPGETPEIYEISKRQVTVGQLA